MKKARLTDAIFVTTENKTGMLDAVCAAVSKEGLNIAGICAGAAFTEAHFILLTDDSAKALRALSSKGLKAHRLEVVTLALNDKKGTLASVAKKIKKARIGLDYVFGTTCGCPETNNLLVLTSRNNKKLVSVLNGK